MILKYRAVTLMVLFGLLLGWSLWDAVKLRTWERTSGTVLEYRQVHHKSGWYQQPLISFQAPSDDDDDASRTSQEEYVFWSKIRQDNIQTKYPVESSNVPVMYLARNPSRAEMVDKVRVEAQTIFALALFAMGVSACILGCNSLQQQQQELAVEPPQQEPSTYYVPVEDANYRPPMAMAAATTTTGQMV